MGFKDYWALKISAITFCICMLVSLASEVASSSSGIVVAGLIIIFLLMVSVLTDAIAVAVVSCDEKYFELLVEANGNNDTYILAAKLVRNKERVNNICADVIGDVCSILNGACGATIVLEIIKLFDTAKLTLLISIICSSIIAALTVGGKAIVKSIAMKKSNEFIIYSAKILTIFIRPFKRLKKSRKNNGNSK